ncbi:MAG: hypothetical protein RIR00_1413, partial [Pseudomonadota bacterium]
MTLTRLLLLGASATLAACAAPAPLNNQPHAFTTLQARSGSTVAGGVAFFEVSGGIRLDVTATGLTPGE